MKTSLLGLVMVMALAHGSANAAEKIELFDGKTFSGWTGDTNKTWRIQDGAFVGGSLQAKVPRNEFLSTVGEFTNFVLRLQCRLVGTEGFVNGGVQIRSQRSKEPANEMSGYQADMGEGWWGALYDESRRNKVLVRPSAEAVQRAVKKDQWNEYVIRCEGPRIRTWINGVEMIDYTEPGKEIPQFGKIGLQIHGGGVSEAHYRKIEVERLP